MRKFDFPLAPVILGLVLGDLMEQSMRQALMISGGELGILFQSTIAKALFGLAIFVVVAPKLMQSLRGWRTRKKT
jgi:putative tricarboxylic transport membrane protein